MSGLFARAPADCENFVNRKFKIPLDFWRKSAIIIIVKREEDNGDSPMEKYSTSKISKENFENPLDNH